ncbi:MAG: hypothetical protein KDC84_07370 [Crocinitomicaceae bacterium]|nr:hypothetical protein [Crocinitomicaceae bacterium]
MKNLVPFFMSLLFLFSGIRTIAQTDTSDYVIVVRLKTAKNQIRAAEETGNKELAKTLRLETRGSNMEIVRAFRENLGSKVFFIYSSDYKNLKQGKTDSIFLNESLEVDLALKPDLSNYYVAFWGNSPGTGMSVIMLLDQNFEETEIWVRTFGLSPANFKRIAPQVKKFCDKLYEKIPKYLDKKKRQDEKQKKG